MSYQFTISEDVAIAVRKNIMRLPENEIPVIWAEIKAKDFGHIYWQEVYEQFLKEAIRSVKDLGTSEYLRNGICTFAEEYQTIDTLKDGNIFVCPEGCHTVKGNLMTRKAKGHRYHFPDYDSILCWQYLSLEHADILDFDDKGRLTVESQYFIERHCQIFAENEGNYFFNPPSFKIVGKRVLVTQLGGLDC